MIQGNSFERDGHSERCPGEKFFLFVLRTFQGNGTLLDSHIGYSAGVHSNSPVLHDVSVIRFRDPLVFTLRPLLLFVLPFVTRAISVVGCSSTQLPRSFKGKTSKMWTERKGVPFLYKILQ